MCLPSDALLQHLPSYWVSLTLDEGYLLTPAPPDLERGIAPLGPPALVQPLLLGRGVAPPSCRPWPGAQGGSSWRSLTLDAGISSQFSLLTLNVE